MEQRNPIYTEKTECQDCYKCVRGCPVKAIRVVDDSATVIPEACLLCGHCVAVCPVGAKRVRDDLGRARQLFRLRERVVVSLAPSWVSEFPGIPAGALIAALKRLGFAAVSETALGAQEVSAHVAGLVAAAPDRLLISTACPTVVSHIRKYHPELVPALTPVFSPVLAHCRLLRAHYGDGLGIVFISPCIAKKEEADRHPELLELALSFAEVRRWFDEEGIDPAHCEGAAEDRFVPRAAEEGGLYPVDGGMIAGLDPSGLLKQGRYMAVSGLGAIERALGELPPVETGIFLELLACEGGCVNGPQAANRNGGLVKRRAVVAHAALPATGFPRAPEMAIDEDYPSQAVPAPAFGEEEVREALRSIGKYSSRDELNCSGCGYDNCRDFATALLAGKAERTMCVSYMRKLAQKKANALIKTMPSGMVIVDGELRVVECNERFASLLGAEALELFAARPGLEGANLAKLVPFHKLFATALESGEELLDHDVRFGKTILHLSIFNIERGHVIGAILQDVTTPAVRKEQVVKKARRVIQRNLAAVQKIAYLLGENAAETEVVLESIIESFEPPGGEGAGEGG